jgi:hypothetical protein
MDWAYAIERHRQPLLGIVATLYAMIGLTDDGRIERLSWPLYRAVLAVLRPAEAAVRRLIVVAARGLVVKPYVPPSGPCQACHFRQGPRTPVLLAVRSARACWSRR